MQAMAGPLSGLRAIEFGQLLAGPFTGTLLGDFGADVIKIEAPGSGDAMRDWGRLRHNNGYPGQAPPRSGISLGDTLAAQSAFQGILLALFARERGAEGQVVDA